MTNRDFAMNVMDPGEANGFIRMWETYLKKVEKPYEPIWIKEQRYNEFMDMEFDRDAWEDACTPKSPGSVPKDFMQSIKWAFRFAGRDDRIAKKAAARKAAKPTSSTATVKTESPVKVETPYVSLVTKEAWQKAQTIEDKMKLVRMTF
jgi:hypothetical protein